MKRLLLCSIACSCLVLTAWSQNTEDQDGKPKRIHIEIAPGVTILWSQVSGMIIRDDAFHHVKANFTEYRETLLRAVQDTTDTGLPMCAKESNLRMGDLAFLLLRELQVVPKDCHSVRFNTYRFLCPCPLHMLDHLETHRTQVTAELEACLPR